MTWPTSAVGLNELLATNAPWHVLPLIAKQEEQNGYANDAKITVFHARGQANGYSNNSKHDLEIIPERLQSQIAAIVGRRRKETAARE